MNTRPLAIDIMSSLVYEVTSPSSFLFNVAVARNDHQSIADENLTISPKVPLAWCDPTGTGCRGLRLSVDPCTLTLEYSASVNLAPATDPPPQLAEVAHAELPPETLTYLNPSRYCESDRLDRFAQRTFGGTTPGHARVLAICDWVNEHIEYVAGSTDASSSACDVLVQRAGVCRDFAHVAISLCRALGIPARYVSGYAADMQPPDFHGFFEAYLGHQWYLFDATRMAPLNGLVRIAVGRDAADASFATIVGQASLRQMTVSATFRDGPAPNPDGAVSTA